MCHLAHDNSPILPTQYEWIAWNVLSEEEESTLFYPIHLGCPISLQYLDLVY